MAKTGNVSKGLPESKGTVITIIASNPSNCGEFMISTKVY